MRNDMPTWFNWTPLSPMLAVYCDDGTRDLCTQTIEIREVGSFEVSLVGTRQRAELIRVATLNSDGNLTGEQVETVDKLMDHALALLKLTADPTYDRLRIGDRTPSIGAHDANGKPALHISMTELAGGDADIGEDFRGALAASIRHRPLIILLADACTPTLPLQYRYLSLYKILELEFRSAGRWEGLTELLEPYDAEFKTLGIGARSLANTIHEVRDKCAHIKVGGADTLGVLGLAGEDARLVEGLTTLLRQIIATHINSKGIGLTIECAPHEREWLPIERTC